MGISRYNPEGYRDPTAYAALTSVEREKKARRRTPCESRKKLSKPIPGIKADAAVLRA